MRLKKRELNTKYLLTKHTELDRNHTAFVCIDLQEQLFDVVKNKKKIKKNAKILLNIAETLGVKSIVCEQYPKGLGNTIFKIPKNCERIEKESFSAFCNESFVETLQKDLINTLVLFGIESHICVRSSALDGIKNNFRVIVVYDATSSRDLQNHKLCIEELRSKGVDILCTETTLFSLLLHCKEKDFKTILQAIK